MKILDILCSPWSIEPVKFQEIQEIYFTHLRGEKIDLKGIEAAIGKPLQNEEQGYTVEHGVAIVPIDGVLAKKMNLFTRISGGSSMQMIGRDFRAAMADPTVRAILLAVDSPGGTVDGTQELAQTILEARGTKPIVTLSDGVMASAAYWIGSAADRVYISGDTVAVGSIGVITSHVDVSKAEEMMGYKTTVISAGKYKAVGSQHSPLSDDDRAVIQDRLDHLYSVFVDGVARNRGTDAETVLKDMADGRIFMGKQAIKAGLVDGVSTLDRLVFELATA